MAVLAKVALGLASKVHLSMLFHVQALTQVRCDSAALSPGKLAYLLESISVCSPKLAALSTASSLNSNAAARFESASSKDRKNMYCVMLRHMGTSWGFGIIF